MPSWRKVILSGSNAALNSLNVTTSITASVVSASSFTGSLLGTSSYSSLSVFVCSSRSTCGRIFGIWFVR